MRMDSRQRLQYRIQSGVFLVLFVTLLVALGWFTNRHALSIDLTSGERNSLSPETARLLDELEKPMKATLFASPVNESRPLLEALFERYRELQPLIEFEILNPDLHPDLLREYDIRYDGEVVLEYAGLSETVTRSTKPMSAARYSGCCGRASAGWFSSRVTANATPTARPTTITACSRNGSRTAVTPWKP